jgi:hypothetical protein
MKIKAVFKRELLKHYILLILLNQFIQQIYLCQPYFI